MDKKRAVLFILLDAFRHDYLTEEDAPTIFAMSKKGVHVKKLVSSSGFTQRSAIFTGALGDVHGNYTMYIHDKNTSPFKILTPFTFLFRVLPKSGLFYRFIRKVINQIPKLTASWAPPGHIPSEILPLISVTEDISPIHHPGSLPVESLFDVFKDNNVKYKYFMAPVSGNDEWTMRKVLNEIEPSHNIYFTQFSDTDGLMHKLGSEGADRSRVVKYTDERVRVLKEKMEQTFDNPWIIVIGDHGMVDVKYYVDIWSNVEEFAVQNNLTHGKDFLMFLDSTLARFWFFTNGTKSLMEPFLRHLLNDNGEFINDEYLQSRQIPNNPKWYGELIWKADVRVGIFPDYFHSLDDKYKSMHGYDCNEDSMKGAGVFYCASGDTSTVIDEGGLEDISSTICDILSLPYPSSNIGRSFLKR